MLKRTREGVHNFVVEKIEASPVIKRTELNVDTAELETYSVALFNSYKFWCRSGAFDYIRAPNHAGFFERWLNEYEMNDEGAARVAEDLKIKTNEAYGTSLELLEVRAVPDRVRRYWTVYITLRDTQSSIVGSGSIEYSLDSGFVTPSTENNHEPPKELSERAKTVSVANAEYSL